jgi:hypothetical protein
MATDGYSRAADTYVRGRPVFSFEALASLTGEPSLHSGKAVIDLAAD